MKQHEVRGAIRPHTWHAWLVAMTSVRHRVAAQHGQKNAYTLKLGHHDADYILFNPPTWDEERENLLQALRTGAYGAVAEKAEFTLFGRGLPKQQADAYIRRIGG